MFTHEQFESGLRLDQYIASIALNKENFRANFIKSIEAYSADDIAFFRSFKERVHVAIVTEDDNPDALRDVPLISRISVEVGRVALRVFRLGAHSAQATLLAEHVGLPEITRAQLPLIVFFDHDMRLLGAHVRRIPELDAEMRKRHSDWVAAHPEIADVDAAIEAMTPITRTRLNQALYAMTPEQRQLWNVKTVTLWRGILTRTGADSTAQEAAPAPAAAAVSAPPAQSVNGSAPDADAEVKTARKTKRTLAKTDAVATETAGSAVYANSVSMPQRRRTVKSDKS